MKNLIINFFNKNYFFVIFKKIIKRFEKNTLVQATKWARLNASQTTEEFCRSIDSNLYDEIKYEVKKIEDFANNKLKNLKNILGGGGNYELLYFIIRKIKPNTVVETGVAAGWTSLAALRAFEKNNRGRLYSSDFPYFRLKNPEQLIGYLAKNEPNINSWYLNIKGDDKALPEIVKKLKNENIDILHYDSDKSYSGRDNALNLLDTNTNDKTIFIFDDIQDNLHFKDFIKKKEFNYSVIQFNNKFVGIANFKIQRD